MADKFIIIDEVGLNATHFTAMQKADAVKAMIADGITKDATWAANAYDELKKQTDKK